MEGFHPSKEGFKGRGVIRRSAITSRFHPSKEGFKGALYPILFLVYRQFPSL